MTSKRLRTTRSEIWMLTSYFYNIATNLPTTRKSSALDQRVNRFDSKEFYMKRQRMTTQGLDNPETSQPGTSQPGDFTIRGLHNAGWKGFQRVQLFQQLFFDVLENVKRDHRITRMRKKLTASRWKFTKKILLESWENRKRRQRHIIIIT